MNNLATWVSGLLNVLLVATICWTIGGLVFRGLRAKRTQHSTVRVLAEVTTNLIGVGVIVLAAFAGGRLWVLLVGSAIHSVALAFCGQLAVGFLAAWLIGQAFRRWLSQPITRWFAAEEATTNG